jgi:hypothetical protein
MCTTVAGVIMKNYRANIREQGRPGLEFYATKEDLRQMTSLFVVKSCFYAK